MRQVTPPYRLAMGSRATLELDGVLEGSCLFLCVSHPQGFPGDVSVPIGFILYEDVHDTAGGRRVIMYRRNTRPGYYQVDVYFTATVTADLALLEVEICEPGPEEGTSADDWAALPTDVIAATGWEGMIAASQSSYKEPMMQLFHCGQPLDLTTLPARCAVCHYDIAVDNAEGGIHLLLPHVTIREAPTLRTRLRDWFQSWTWRRPA